MGTFEGHNHHFTWEERGVDVQLPTDSSIRTVTVQEYGIASKFVFPSSTHALSSVYELSCSCGQGDSPAATTAAEITISCSSERSASSFFLASRTPTYFQCDLSPVYCFRAMGGGVFDSDGSKTRARIAVKEFDCLLCVCQT